MAGHERVKLSQQLCNSSVCSWEMRVKPLLLRAGALDEAAGQQLTQRGIPTFAMFDAQGGSSGLPTGELGLLYGHVVRSRAADPNRMNPPLSQYTQASSCWCTPRCASHAACLQLQNAAHGSRNIFYCWPRQRMICSVQLILLQCAQLRGCLVPRCMLEQRTAWPGRF